MSDKRQSHVRIHNAHEYVVTLTDEQACALRYMAHERVIRCEDCIHFREWGAPEGHYEVCDRTSDSVSANGFCAWAKPKEDS